MTKVSVLLIFFAALATAVLCDLLQHPTYQTTREVPKTRSARQIVDDFDLNPQKSQPLNSEPVIKDGDLRVTRSVDSPSARRGGGSHTTSSGSRDAGPTHPGYNRRNTRSVDDEPLWLYKGDDVIRAPATGEHPRLPTYIDDVKTDPNHRYARSLLDDVFSPRPWEPLFPRPRRPSPFDPTFPEPKRPIYIRNRRDFQYPKWNPHVPSGPWAKIPSRKH